MILPVKTSHKIAHEEERWFMDEQDMPVTVYKNPHIDIQRDSRNSGTSTVEENIKKARRTLYSQMQTGLHGENWARSDDINKSASNVCYVNNVLWIGDTITKRQII